MYLSARPYLKPRPGALKQNLSKLKPEPRARATIMINHSLRQDAALEVLKALPDRKAREAWSKDQRHLT